MTNCTKGNTTGFELNFWGMPSFSQPKKVSFLKVCNAIELTFGFNGADNTIGFGMKVGSWEGYQNLPLLNQNWVNLNLRVMYGNYSLLNGWQGNNWYELNPSLRVLYLNHAN